MFFGTLADSDIDGHLRKLTDKHYENFFAQDFGTIFLAHGSMKHKLNSFPEKF